ncbi:hypothetical protein [Parabacteroides chinchillae]|uniref:Uncharacterized protein n=1 Tax=Parabacteroides chinchillae TaxID=871327 RepID=A0A8G2BWD7_9BACT|nr:hypothetical protein [Parabacteroides chinchillae]SEF86185.1 hypothetical protein SAMN05444001_108110 [Parabacteroides chinchillae]
MNWDLLLSMLGTGGLVAFVNWLINLKATRRKSVLDKDEISRIMAERDNETILNLYNENRNILEKLASLESMLYKLVVCKHFDTCPARYELQNYKQNNKYQRARQSTVEQKGKRYPRDNPVQPGKVDNPDGQPP